MFVALRFKRTGIPTFNNTFKILKLRPTLRPWKVNSGGSAHCTLFLVARKRRGDIPVTVSNARVNALRLENPTRSAIRLTGRLDCTSIEHARFIRNLRKSFIGPLPYAVENRSAKDERLIPATSAKLSTL